MPALWATWLVKDLALALLVIVEFLMLGPVSVLGREIVVSEIFGLIC